MVAEPTPPGGCQHCGITPSEHMQRWKPPIGWHQWTAPTQAQIKDRMQARREAHLNTRKDTP